MAPKKRSRFTILGPLFWFDLLADTRRGSHLILRVLVGFLMLVVLYLFYSADLNIEPFEEGFKPTRKLLPSQIARFAYNFAAGCLVVQYFLVLIVTPLVVADAIAKEKERRSLEFYFVTDLTDREIVLGKFGSRVAQLLGVLLTGFPIVGLTQLFGGVSLELFLGGYAVIFATVIGLSSLCLCASVVSRTSTLALVRSYGLTLIYIIVFAISLPFAIRLSDTTAIIAYVVANVAIALASLVFSVEVLRPHGLLGERASRNSLRPMPSARLPVQRNPAFDRSGDRQPSAEIGGLWSGLPVGSSADIWQQPLSWERLPLQVDDRRPLLWKEVHFHSVFRKLFQTDVGFLQRSLRLFLGIVIMMAAIISVLIPIAIGDEKAIRTLVRLVAAIFGTLIGLFVLLQATNSIIREKERDTLDGLLTLPGDRTDILESKWLAGFWDQWFFAGILVATLAWAFFCGYVHLLSLVLLPLCMAAFFEFVASLGLWISVTMRSSFRANMVAIGIFFAVAFGPWAIWHYLDALLNSGMQIEGWERILSYAAMPPFAWSRSIFSADELRNMPKNEIAIILGFALGYAILGWCFWRISVWRFRQQLVQH